MSHFDTVVAAPQGFEGTRQHLKPAPIASIAARGSAIFIAVQFHPGSGAHAAAAGRS